MDDDAPRWYGDSHTIEIRIVNSRVQLALFEAPHPAPDDLPDVIVNLAPLEAANLGDWLQEYCRRAIRDA